MSETIYYNYKHICRKLLILCNFTTVAKYEFNPLLFNYSNLYFDNACFPHIHEPTFGCEVYRGILARL